MRKKVLFLITKSNFGGAQRYVHDLAVGLAGEDYDVVVAFGGTGLPSAPTGKLHELLHERGIRTIHLKHFARDIFLLLEIRAFVEVFNLIRREKPDIVHTNSSKAGGLGALAARILGVLRIVFTSHGIVYEESRRPWQLFFIKLATWGTIFAAHSTIAVTQTNAMQLKTLPLIGHKIRLVHNGIENFRLQKREAARQFLMSFSEHETIPTEVPWIGTISELIPNKGLGYTLEACAKLKARGHRFVCVIISDGEERERLEKQASELGVANEVYFLGFVPHAREYLHALDIFTLTSIKEGLPYVLIEAGFANLPVVTTNVGGVLDIVEHEITGLIVEPKNTEAVANAIERVLLNPKEGKRLGEALGHSIRGRFSLARMITDTRAVYELRT